MKKLTIILSLVLSLTLCFGALAEQTSAAENAEKTETTQVQTVADQDLTKAAVDAYKALKKSAKAAKKLDAIKEELDAFVADGRLTQEQADLVLKYYTEKLSSHGDKGTQKQQTGEKPGGKGQQKQKNNAQTQNGKGGKRTQPTNNGTSGSGADAASGATKKGK